MKMFPDKIAKFLFFVRRKLDMNAKQEDVAPTLIETPNRDKHFARLHAVEGSVDHYTRSMLIVAFDGEDEDSQDHSEEQLSLLRHIILTTNRQKCIDRMRKLFNPNDGLFDTYTGKAALIDCSKKVTPLS